MKAIKFLIYFLFCLTLSISCTTQRYFANTRSYFKMPRLIDVQKFKNEMPINDLISLRNYAKDRQYSTPILEYFFSIDSTGDISNGKLDNLSEDHLKFFKPYVNNIFASYRWHPAFYTNTKEKLRTAAKMSIYDNREKHIFEVTIRLIYLPDKEKMQDVSFEKNLIYRFIIK